MRRISWWPSAGPVRRQSWEVFLASDIPAFLGETKEIVVLDSEKAGYPHFMLQEIFECTL